MNLSYDIISQFAKVVNSDKKEKNSESTVYGVIVADGNGNRYVKLDGSDQLTPLSDDECPSADSTTTNIAIGDRVAVTIKNHTATITGNTSSPSVRTDDFDELHSGVEQIVEFDNAIIKKVQANEGYIKKLQTDKAEVGDLSAANAKIEELEVNKASVKDLNAAKGEIQDLKTKKLDAEAANLKYATIENLTATNANVGSIAGKQANFEETVTQNFSAVNADIVNLKTKKIDAEEAKLRYADIDFANIGKAAIEAFYAKSGIIKDLVIGDTTVSGKLVGVTIIGDLIEGGTVKADKLVIQGTDGLYYKLNTDGMKTTAEQTEYNSLNGSIITAKSITAEKCNIHDLVAFDATIGGFTITDDTIYSGVKNNINASVHGTYIDKNGQVAFGDSESYLKYYKDSKGKWKLEIAADNIRFSSSDKTLAEEVDSIKSDVENTITSVYAEYYLSTSTTSATGGTWSTEAPQWIDGKYMWSRTVITYNNGNIDYSPNQNGVCIAGAKGATGLQGLQGPKGDQGIAGADGKDSHFHIKYSSVASPTSASQMSETPNIYIGTYVDYTATDSDDPKKYTWYRFQGLQGDKGDKGIPGTNGINGKTSYLHLKYSNDGGKTFTANSGEAIGDYIGQCTDFNETDPTSVSAYTWSKIKGDKGDTGLQGYSLVAHVTRENNTENWWNVYGEVGHTESWGNTESIRNNCRVGDIFAVVGTASDTGNSHIAYYRSDTASGDLHGVCISHTVTPRGAKGDKGDTGKGVKSTEITYQSSTSGTTIPTGTWNTSIPSVVAGSFLWTRTIITYSDNTKSTSYSVGQMGENGSSLHTLSTQYKYNQSYIDMYSKDGYTDDWTVDDLLGAKIGDTVLLRLMNTSKNNYAYIMGRVIKILTSTRMTVTSLGLIDKGDKGDKGDTGKGVKSTEITYQAGSSGISIPTDVWIESVPATSALKPFLWTKTVITYTDNTTSTSYSVGSTPDSIQIGGRNLYKGTKDFTGDAWFNNDNWISDGTVNGFVVKKRSKALWAGLVQAINAEIGDIYTYSAYVKTDAPGNILCIWHCGTQDSNSANATILKMDSPPVTANVYVKMTLTFEITKSGIIRPGIEPQKADGNVWVYGIKVEKGNKATDWTPAPEDIESQFTETNTRLTRAETSISNNSNEINLKASTESLTELANKANQIDKTLSDAQILIQKNMDAIATLTSRDFKVEFTTITNQIAKVNGDLTSYKNEIGNWMRFDASGNLVLGATRVPGQDAYELKLTKNRISFMLNDNEVAYISSNQLYILNAVVVMNFRIGYVEWVTRGNGNTGLVPRYKGV